MAQTIVVKLIDDIDGGEADETVKFGLDNKAYEIELNAGNAARLRNALAPYIKAGRPAGRGRSFEPPRSVPATKTLFSELSAEERVSFRRWADMPTARRVSDARVRAWIEAGRP
ncbi:MAG: Lsr2 family protein [Acidimicrobiales bacterium]|jgi:hypothetical protein